jgi:queuine/archaeosine tRNA-ribosyltransferase
MPIGKYAYHPVYFFGSAPLEGHMVLGKEPEYWTWWNKEKSVFYHPHLLLNAWTDQNTPTKRLNEKIGLDVGVLGDSGGFQIWKQTLLKGKPIDIDPIKILRWQERNCDVAFTIDWPVGSDDSDEVFEHGLKETVKNCQIYQDNLQRSDMRVLRVLHGHSNERIKRFYDAL